MSPRLSRPTPTAPAAATSATAATLRHFLPQPSAFESAELLRGRKVVEIAHNGAVYRLQATKLGKLILTK